MKFQVGDRVMVIENTYPESQYLGEIGMITNFTLYGFKVLWPDKLTFEYSEYQLCIATDPNELLKEIL